MTNALTTAAAWAATQFDSSCATSITYARGAATVTLPATVCGARASLPTPAGQVRVPTGENDFIVTAASLILSGAVAKPQPGDVITYGAQTYRVAAVPGEPCWRQCDSSGIRIRIHAKRSS